MTGDFAGLPEESQSAGDNAGWVPVPGQGVPPTTSQPLMPGTQIPPPVSGSVPVGTQQNPSDLRQPNWRVPPPGSQPPVGVAAIGFQPYGVRAYDGRSCPACSNPTIGSAVMCVNCGTPLAASRSKGIALILAVLGSFLTWLYTYRRDTTKFWIGFAASIVGIIASVVVIGVFVLLGIWVWAIIDTALKPESWYQQYPNPVSR